MKEDRLRFLLRQHIQQRLDEQHMDEMFALIDSLGQDRYESILDELLKELPNSPTNSISEDQKKELIQKVLQQVEQQPKSKVITAYIPLLKWAAIFIVFCSCSLLVWRFTHEQIQTNDAANVIANPSDIYLTQDSLPQLTLADGRSYAVAPQAQAQLQNIGLHLQFDSDNNIRIQSPDGTLTQQQLCFATPKGYTSKVLLADGTKIWLNSNSKIFYPAKFSNTERRIKLEGEAYFEVSHDSQKPFYVEMALGTIKVLGTTFNVSSYASMHKSTTTLLSGKVEIKQGTAQIILHPEEQAIVTDGAQKIEKRNVNVTEFTSWMQDYYLFNDKTIQEILLTVQNWYDIDGIDVKVDNHELFTGTLKRSKSLKSLLAHLEKLSNLKLELQGRRIVVMK